MALHGARLLWAQLATRGGRSRRRGGRSREASAEAVAAAQDRNWRANASVGVNMSRKEKETVRDGWDCGCSGRDAGSRGFREKRLDNGFLERLQVNIRDPGAATKHAYLQD